jgi:hypothetical protein
MKNIVGSFFGIVLLLGAVAIASAQSGDSGRLAGAWDVVVTPRVCATGNAITTFQASYYFAPGGTFSGVSSGTGSGGRGREQLGVWKHLYGNHYRFRIKTYLFDAAGVATSYQIVTHDGELDDDALNWASTGDSRTFSLDNVQINAGCSTIIASRVVD